MSPPPPEHLIHDYLTRLSAAARGRLTAAERRALVKRTHQLIHRNTGLLRTTTAPQVGRLLSGLGDPAGLVEQEVKRLGARRGKPQEPHGTTVHRGARARISWPFRRAPGTASWHWPVQEGRRADLQQQLMSMGDDPDSVGEPPAIPEFGSGRVEVVTRPITARWRPGKPVRPRPPRRPRWPIRGRSPDVPAADVTAPADVTGSADVTAPADVTAAPDVTGSGDVAIVAVAERAGGADASQAPAAAGRARPAWPGAAAHAGMPAVTGGSPAPERPHWPSVVARSAPRNGDITILASPIGPAAATGDGAVAANGSSAGQQAAGSRAAATADDAAADDAEAGATARLAVGWARRLAGAGWRWVRVRPLETAAVLLLGVGGASYPPVWLLGAVVALFSSRWDYRDNWLGLGLPVLLTVVGAIAGIAAGGHTSFGHDVHDGWMFAEVLSRLCALLGAAYLAWRATRGKSEVIPPWKRPSQAS